MPERLSLNKEGLGYIKKVSNPFRKCSWYNLFLYLEGRIIEVNNAAVNAYEFYKIRDFKILGADDSISRNRLCKELIDIECEAYAAKPIDTNKLLEVMKKLGIIE